MLDLDLTDRHGWPADADRPKLHRRGDRAHGPDQSHHLSTDNQARNLLTIALRAPAELATTLLKPACKALGPQVRQQACQRSPLTTRAYVGTRVTHLPTVAPVRSGNAKLAQRVASGRENCGDRRGQGCRQRERCRNGQHVLGRRTWSVLRDSPTDTTHDADNAGHGGR